MKKIDLDQGTDKWLSWRKTVITATDCPAIMGSSPWSTAYKCWQKKLGLVEEQKSNEAMERGKRLEPEARAQFSERFGINMNSVVVESDEFDFLGASLDGLSDCGKYIVEIKCGGWNLHKQALDGHIPPYYRHQIQHQLLVTGAEKAFYYSYDGKQGVCIEVNPDRGFKEGFLPKAREFWRCVAFAEPPPLEDSDYKDMSDEPKWRIYSEKYRKVSEQIKSLEQVKEDYRQELLTLCEDKNCTGNGVKALKMVLKGRVAYDEIPEIKNVDLDKYRKGSTTTWKIFVA